MMMMIYKLSCVCKCSIESRMKKKSDDIRHSITKERMEHNIIILIVVDQLINQSLF